MNVLVQSILSDDADQVATLIASHSLDLNALVDAGHVALSPLMIASEHGRTAIARMLLDAGALINNRASHGRTALHFAADHDRVQVSKLLLERGADPQMRDVDGRTALDFAVFGADDELATVLIEAGAPVEYAVTLCAASAMSTRVLQLLIDRQINVSQLRDHNDHTPLHYFARHAPPALASASAVFAELIKLGVDLDAKNVQGRSCTSFAAESPGLSTALRLFVEAGADVDSTANSGWTPLHHACAKVNVDNVILLVAAGADVGANGPGETPLHFALAPWVPTAVDRSIVAALVAFGAEFDSPNKIGKSARQVAAEKKFAPIADDELRCARNTVTAVQLTFVRERALQVCVGLQAFNIDALQMCEILRHACGPVARFVAFHHWWQIATIVKHFRRR